MAIVQRVNGSVQVGQFVGRELQYFTVTKAAAADAAALKTEMDALVQALELFGTVEVIGNFDVAATSINFIMSGVAPGATNLAAINAAIAPASIAVFAF